MKKLLLLSSCLAMLASTAATAQDETCDTDGDNVADYDNLGGCDGTDAVWCTGMAATDELARVTCGALPAGEGEPTIAGTCQVFDNWGSWCILPTGTPGCGGFTDDGTLVAFACGDSSAAFVADSGCDLNDGCIDSVGTCTPGAMAPPTCLGSRLTFACTAWSQWVTINCTTGGLSGSCGAAGSGSACLQETGAQCLPGSGFECGAGLACNGATDQTAGTCGTPGAGEGEGEGEGEGDGEGEGEGPRRDDEAEPPPESGCSSTDVNTTAPLAGLFAFIAVLPLVRRRRR